MKGKFTRLTLLLILVAMVATSLLVPMQAFAAKITTTATGYTSADDVKYVTSGKYIANWGARGETATFLSKYAQAFYTGNYTFANLSNASGGTSQSNASNSTLYKQLKELMTNKHTHQTSYGETRDQYKYTDCVGSNYNKISSFYSGKELNGAWDSGSTWNREHTWPNSKGLGGNDENDIMMLRPTWVSENSSRGNTAYGESGSYYDPGESTRGDCARIVLYVYTRWGNTGRMWGTSGVMESMDVLLKWMEQDPVDTWEMGRNDAVQAITGTRNVFVDYPEYAFLLFGKSVPNNYPTPSQSNGVTPEPPKPHTCDYTPATCTEPATCKICYATQGEALGHTAPDSDGKCTRCGEILEISAPDRLEVGAAYYLSVVQGNLDNKILYFNGTTREADGYPWYFKTSEDKANAVQVFVEEAQGGYRLYFMNGTTKTYIRLYERSSGKASLELVTTVPAEVYAYDTTHKTLILTVGSNKYYMGTYDTFDTLSGSNISYIDTSFPCRFVPAEGGTTPPAHTCESKCPTCGGCTDASCTESACTTKCQGHQITPPVVTPDETVNAFKSAVTNIQSATTMQQKFDAIKVAADAYNSLNDTQKAQVTAELEQLKTAIADYNASAATQNTNSINVLYWTAQVSLIVTMAVALVLLKKVF
ncbi:MAG: endonuclease [Clostridia bacterium]|nr:endonuclease [Clostridia bacterium]